jgi:hypothetical protein
MTYYEESTFLDLSKEIYSMQYHSLIDEATLRSHDDEEDQQAHEVDFSTNAYLFFKEKHIMKLDILNLCRFLELKCLSRGSPAEELSKVPFGAIHTRINQILQKYHEQPALLDKISKFIILQSMEIIKKLVHRYIEDYIKSLKAGHALAPLFDLGGCEVLKILYILIGIRGQDRVLRHFPHEPQDFEPLIFVLASR